MAALDEQPLVFGLRHPARCAPHPLVRTAFVGEGSHVHAAIDRGNDDLAARLDLDAVDGHVGVRLEAIGGLSDVAKRLVGDGLPLGGTFRPDAEEHPATGAVQKGAERLHAFFQLARRALELQSLAFAFLDEGGKLSRGRGNPHVPHGRFPPYGGESSGTCMGFVIALTAK